MPLDARAYIKCGFFTCCLRQPVHAYMPVKVTLAGNDTGSSPPSSVLHAGFLFNIYT